MDTIKDIKVGDKFRCTKSGQLKEGVSQGAVVRRNVVYTVDAVRGSMNEFIIAPDYWYVEPNDEFWNHFKRLGDIKPSAKKIVTPGIKDSGERRDFSTGAQRDRAAGKGRFDLLPVTAIFALAKQLEGGATKYAPRNWEKGMPLSVYLDSALRHLFKYLGGLRDEDHLAAALFNVAALQWTKKAIEEDRLPEELDDLPSTCLRAEDFPS